MLQLELHHLPTALTPVSTVLMSQFELCMCGAAVRHSMRKATVGGKLCNRRFCNSQSPLAAAINPFFQKQQAKHNIPHVTV
jgi:hypothetical protein